MSGENSSSSLKSSRSPTPPLTIPFLQVSPSTESVVRNDLAAPWGDCHSLFHAQLTSHLCQVGDLCWDTGHCSMHCNSTSSQDSKHCSSSSILTLSRRHLFSLMAPMQPTKPMIMTNVPVTISRLAADRDGKEEERVAKFPWVTASQMPTPKIPQPPNWENKEKQRNSVIVSKQPQIWNHVSMAVEQTSSHAL